MMSNRDTSKFYKLVIIVFSILVLPYLTLFSFKIIFNLSKLQRVEKISEDLKEKKLNILKKGINLNTLLKETENSFDIHSNINYFLKKSSLAYELATKHTNINMRKDYFCISLSSLGKGLYFEPYNAKLLSSYAVIKRILLKVNCPYEYTKADYKKVIELALKYDPTNLRVIRDAGRIAILDSNYEEAAKHYKKYLRLNQRRNKIVDSGVKFILEQGIPLKNAIPTQFEQVYYWSLYLYNNDKDYFNKNRAEFEKLQISSVLELRKLFIEKQTALSYLRSISQYKASDKVRKIIDKELVYYLDDSSNEVINFLEIRSNLSNQPVICGLKRGDSRPEHSNITDWGSKERLYLDNDYQSVGCKVKDFPKFIEVKNLYNLVKIDPNDIELYVSKDNYNWAKVSDNIKFKIVDLNLQTILYADITKTDNFKYYKVRYKELRTQRAFFNSLDQMLNFYY